MMPLVSLSYVNLFRNRIILIVILVWCSIPHCSVNAEQLALKTYTRATGLASDYVLCIFQDRSGQMWFGTDRGVSMYDGHAWRTFSTEDGLRHNLVYCIFQDRDGAMWFGTYDGGVTKYDGVHLRTWNSDSSLHDNTVTTITQDRFGKMWFQTRYGTCYFKRDSTFATLPFPVLHTLGPFPDGSTMGLSNGKVVRRVPTASGSVADIVVPASNQVINWLTSYLWAGTVYTDSKGEILIPSQGFLIRLRDEKGILQIDTLISGTTVTACVDDGKGALWVSTEDKGIGKLTAESLHWYTEREGLARGRVKALIRDYEGTFWFGTFGGGVQKLLSEKMSFFKVDDGLLTNDITRVYEDSRNRLWIASSKGVNLIRDDRVLPITTFDSHIQDVRAFAEDVSGNLYIGNFNGLLGPLQTIPGIPVQPRLLPEINYGISSLFFESVNGRSTVQPGQQLWVGTYGSGLHRLSGDSLQTLTMKDGLPSDMIENMIGSDSSLWLLSRDKGATRLRNYHIETYSILQGLPSNMVNTVYEQPGNGKGEEIWFGTDKGVVHFINEKVELIDASNGLLGNNVLGIYPDKHNRNSIWIVTDKSLQKWTSGLLEPLGPIDFAPLNEVSINGVCFSSSTETFWLATSGGVVKIHPTGMRNHLPSPKVVIKSMAIDSILFPGGLTSSLQLNHSQNNPLFEFAGLSFIGEEGIRYRYKLAGVDENWSQLTYSPRVQYRNLTDGSYTFLVVAVNEEGTQSITPAGISFTILPPFWKRWWFLGIMSITAAVSFASAVRYLSTVKLRQKVSELERERVVQEERERISRDLHDHVGSQLVSMISGLDLVGKYSRTADERTDRLLNSLQEDARTSVTQLRETIWAMKSTGMNLEQFSEYVETYARRHVEMKDGLELQFISTVNSELLLSPIQVLNYFRIIQEALTNCIKHSKTDQVKIMLGSTEDDMLTIIVQDKGPASILNIADEFSGNGLANMRRRAEELGGSCRSGPLTEGGWEVKAVVPLAHSSGRIPLSGY